MKEFWEKVEHFNARLIPYAVVGLLVVIVIELVFHDFAEHYHLALTIIDSIVIAIFVIDLIFLGIKAKNVKFFFKHYWLDLLAVFPFAFGFKIVARFALLGGNFVVGQAILHESLEARKGVRALTRAGKFVRIGARITRVITKSRLFTKVTEKHHIAHRHVFHGKKIPKKHQRK